MNLFLDHFKPLLFCLILGSCGLQNKGLRTQRVVPLLGYNEIQCYGFRSEVSDEVIDIVKIGERVQEFKMSNGFPSISTSEITNNSLLGFLSQSPRTFYSPLVTSESLLKEYMVSLRSILTDSFSTEDSEILENFFFKGEVISSIKVFENVPKVYETMDLVLKLAELATRWNERQCAIPFLKRESNKDIRDFLKIKTAFLSKEEMNNLISEYEEMNDLQKQPLLEVKNNVVKLCYEMKLSDSNCESDWLNYIPRIYEYYETYSKEMFFDITTHGGSFQCQKEGEYNVLSIPIQYANSDEKERISSLLKYSILKDWSHPESKLKIKFIESPELSKDQAFRILDKRGGTSHVNLNNPLEIVINRNLGWLEYGITLSHEFGHVLGFNDCYVEFYSEENDEIVYYELDKGNRMCSIDVSSKISLEQLNMVEDKYCN